MKDGKLVFVKGYGLRMVADNPTSGAPRIHGELLMLGFEVSERTVSRWVKPAPRNPEPTKRWLAFLWNHREAIAAMDFFTVPTITFGVLYCLFSSATIDDDSALWYTKPPHEIGCSAFPSQASLLRNDSADILGLFRPFGARREIPNGNAYRWNLVKPSD